MRFELPNLKQKMEVVGKKAAVVAQGNKKKLSRTATATATTAMINGKDKVLHNIINSNKERKARREAELNELMVPDKLRIYLEKKKGEIKQDIKFAAENIEWATPYLGTEGLQKLKAKFKEDKKEMAVWWNEANGRAERRQRRGSGSGARSESGDEGWDGGGNTKRRKRRKTRKTKRKKRRKRKKTRRKK